MSASVPDHRPSFPAAYRPGIGIVGCGGIVKLAHLPAYTAYGVDVVGVYDPSADATRDLQERFPVVGRVFESFDELLDDPRIEVVDVATHPAQRVELMQRALRAGKHVLSQKPFALDVGVARELVSEAERRGLRIAVNQNGRWAPAWRIATLLVEQGAIGEVCAVTHLYEHDFDWTLGSWPDELEHFVINDFSAHWIDISRCWLDGKTPVSVRALEYRNPAQPAEAKAPWGRVDPDRVRGWLDRRDSQHRLGVRPPRQSVLDPRPGGHDSRQRSQGDRLRRAGARRRRLALPSRRRVDARRLRGHDGGALQCDRRGPEPFNSGRHNLLSVELTLAACRSAELDGAPVAVEGREASTTEAA